MASSSSDEPRADERLEPAHDRRPLSEGNCVAFRERLEVLSLNVALLDPRFVRQLIKMAPPGYTPKTPADEYAHDMSKPGLHPRALAQIEKRGNTRVTGIASDNDTLVGKILSTGHRSCRRVPLAPALFYFPLSRPTVGWRPRRRSAATRLLQTDRQTDKRTRTLAS